MRIRKRIRLPLAIYSKAFSPKQKALAKKHGNPAEFAKACYAACPEFVSMDEAAVAVAKYNQEWNQSK